jgi:hypothetical protein
MDQRCDIVGAPGVDNPFALGAPTAESEEVKKIHRQPARHAGIDNECIGTARVVLDSRQMTNQPLQAHPPYQGRKVSASAG